MIWLTGFLFLDYCFKVLCQCSGTPLLLTAREIPTSFASPGYPADYSNNEYCEWLIDSGVIGQPIVLYGDDMFLDCANGDLIQIYDGSTTGNTTLAANLCSTSVTVEYFSTGRYVLVTFTSDASTTGQGFQITYLSAADTSGTGCTAEYSLSASVTPQYLTSNGFPSMYSSYSACRWLITASTTLSTLNISITWSDIETDTDCAYDKLTIYDGQYVCENDVMLTDCTSRTSASATPTVYITTYASALVVFSSDDSLNRYGFVIQFSENLYTTTSSTSTTTTTAVTTTTAETTASVTTTQQQISSSETEKVLDFPLMVASGVGGAGFVLLILAMYHLIKYISSKKKQKKGLMKVQTIAPLPARTMFYPRQQPHTLSFV